MKRLKLVVLILCLTLVVLAIPSGVKADEWNRELRCRSTIRSRFRE